ncbi:MAG: class I SAM-dependent methyltransferase [Acidimicrobiia bacterium]
MSIARVREAYGARAAEYINRLGTIDAASEHDREYLLAWARAVDGRIIDVGCGPGQWTNFLHENGVDIEGVDPVAEFINDAQQRYPRPDYRIGRADRLGVDDASLGGLLAWFSLIHHEPDQIDEVLTEFARCVRPGGGLTIGFFESAELAAFDHAVMTAYSWPVGALSSRIEEAGFVIVDVHTRTDPETRPQGAIIAQRTA